MTDDLSARVIDQIANYLRTHVDTRGVAYSELAEHICEMLAPDVIAALDAKDAEIERLRRELLATRHAWANGDEPSCEDICEERCMGPCGLGGLTPADIGMVPVKRVWLGSGSELIDGVGPTRLSAGHPRPVSAQLWRMPDDR